MNREEKLSYLAVPTKRVDVVLDTDAYNEIDDQFAIAYMMKSTDKINVRAILAAPFYNGRSKDPKDGMEKSYDEIMKLLSLMKETIPVFKGSEQFLKDEKTPVCSEAVDRLVELSQDYSLSNRLYVVAIGAITNVASAFLVCPEMKDRVVVVWLGGHAHHFHHTAEFNMMQDVAAARVVMQSGAPFIQLPCVGVVDRFTISKPELEYWLKGKNDLADYLATNAINEAESYAKGTPWTRVIWDVTAVAWLLNDNNRFMLSRIIPTVVPGYDNIYEEGKGDPMTYVYHIERDALMDDLISKLTK